MAIDLDLFSGSNYRLTIQNYCDRLPILLFIFDQIVKIQGLKKMEVMERLTLGLTEKILLGFSNSYEKIANRTYLFTMNDIDVVLFNEGDSLTLSAFFPGKHSMSKANEWNETKRYTKAFIELNGTIVLESNYSFDGGVTPANLAWWFKIFRESLKVFCQEVL